MSRGGQEDRRQEGRRQEYSTERRHFGTLFYAGDCVDSSVTKSLIRMAVA
jgi:hypothetical protein